MPQNQFPRTQRRLYLLRFLPTLILACLRGAPRLVLIVYMGFIATLPVGADKVLLSCFLILHVL